MGVYAYNRGGRSIMAKKSEATAQFEKLKEVLNKASTMANNLKSSSLEKLPDVIQLIFLLFLIPKAIIKDLEANGYNG